MTSLARAVRSPYITHAQNTNPNRDKAHAMQSTTALTTRRALTPTLAFLLSLAFCLGGGLAGGFAGEALAKEKAEAGAKKSGKGSKRKALAKTLDKKMKGSNGYGLLGLRLIGNFASINQELTGSKDPLIEDPSSSLSVGFGLTFDRAVNRLLSFHAEALFQNKNFTHKAPVNYDLNSSEKKVESVTHLDYIEVPVGLIARFMYGQRIRPYATAGLYGAFLINADGTHSDVGENTEARLPFSSFDAGWYLGGGSFFVLGEDLGFLSAELRYSRGFANVADTTVETTNKKTPLKAQIYTMGNLSFSVSYHF